METAEEIIWPFGVRNFKCVTGVGDCSQRERKSTAVMPFSGGQIADNNGASPDSALPNTSTAAGFARNTTPLASTSNAGHAEPSKPNTISDFILLLEPQVTSPMENFKARSHASVRFLSNSAAKVFIR